MMVMDSSGLKQRHQGSDGGVSADSVDSTSRSSADPHPAGKVKIAAWFQVVRMLAFATWFNACCVSIHMTQFLGTPLYLINKDYYYAWMALTKQSFGLVIITITQWFAPTLVRVSGDASVRGQIRRAADGRLETDFPERLILISNHQIYTDWLYLWWIAYTSRLHGHIYIILKEGLKYVPFIGPGMMFFGFVFMKRKWASDKVGLQHRLGKLKGRHGGPMAGSGSLDPMWLLLYPEGTNLSANTRKASKKWAEKNNMPDLNRQLLPRSTGLLFCLKELQGTVDWIYDCTVAYEGTPKSGYAAELFTLRSTYFQGRPPKSVNLYWRRFAVADVPIDDPEAFQKWVEARWQEKEQLLEHYFRTGLFPADEASFSAKGNSKAGYVDTEVKLRNWYEVGQLFVVPAALALVADVVSKLLTMFFLPFRK